MADTPDAPDYTTPQTFQTRNRKFKWELNGVSTGKPVRVADYPDKTFHIVAPTYGSATVLFEGSNDERADPDHANYSSSVWVTLTDTTETDISFTSGASLGGQVLQNYEWVRPRTSGGTNTDITAYLNVGKVT